VKSGGYDIRGPGHRANAKQPPAKQRGRELEVGGARKDKKKQRVLGTKGEQWVNRHTNVERRGKLQTIIKTESPEISNISRGKMGLSHVNARSSSTARHSGQKWQKYTLKERAEPTWRCRVASQYNTSENKEGLSTKK